jgi:hypothetical protein
MVGPMSVLLAITMILVAVESLASSSRPSLLSSSIAPSSSSSCWGVAKRRQAALILSTRGGSSSGADEDNSSSSSSGDDLNQLIASFRTRVKEVRSKELNAFRAQILAGENGERRVDAGVDEGGGLEDESVTAGDDELEGYGSDGLDEKVAASLIVDNADGDDQDTDDDEDVDARIYVGEQEQIDPRAMEESSNLLAAKRVALLRGLRQKEEEAPADADFALGDDDLEEDDDEEEESDGEEEGEVAASIENRFSDDQGEPEEDEGERGDRRRPEESNETVVDNESQMAAVDDGSVSKKSSLFTVLFGDAGQLAVLWLVISWIFG